MSRPATAGPAIHPNDVYIDWRAKPAGRRSCARRSGSNERTTAKLMAVTPLATGPTTYSNHGPNSAAPSSPTANDEWVWSNTWKGKADVVIIEPNKDTPCPAHS